MKWLEIVKKNKQKLVFAIEFLLVYFLVLFQYYIHKIFIFVF